MKGANEPTIRLKGRHHLEVPVADLYRNFGPQIKLIEVRLTVRIVAGQKSTEVYGSKRENVVAAEVVLRRLENEYQRGRLIPDPVLYEIIEQAQKVNRRQKPTRLKDG
jgi:phosphate starvation-inducible protein PhoH